MQNSTHPAAASPTDEAGRRATEPITTVRVSLACGLLAASVQAAVIAPFLGRYGWDRDELCFLSASRLRREATESFSSVTFGWLVL